MKRYQRSLIWFRRDLRLEDQRALFEACNQSQEVLPIFVFDPHILNKLSDKSDARVSFIFDVLQELQERLKKKNKTILIEYGTPEIVLPKVCEEYKIQAVFVNEDYEPSAIARDQLVQQKLQKKGIDFFSFKDQVIIAPCELKNLQGKPYQVFTPYKKAWISYLYQHQEIINNYSPQIKFLMDKDLIKTKVKSLADIKFKSNRMVDIDATKVTNLFFKKINHYHTERDFPAQAGTSKLSIHLRFGTVSVRELVRKVFLLTGKGSEVWLSEIIWREFYMMILGNFPHVVTSAFKAKYDKIIWPNNKRWFERWCQGETGFPIIDAGMHELNSTGWMHNRVRMITASFLCKILLIDWRLGEAYFAQKLLDFDLSANNGGWQWSSSSGCDAAPYFRIFNPYTQTEKFDPEGEYLARYAPKIGASPMVNYPEQRARCLMLYKKYL